MNKVKISFVLVVVHNVKKTSFDVDLRFYYDEIPSSMVES